MEKGYFKQKWDEIRKKIQNKWNKLTNEDISEIDGEYDQLLMKIEERYGFSREQAERELQKWDVDVENQRSEQGMRQGKPPQKRNEQAKGDRDWGDERKKRKAG